MEGALSSTGSGPQPRYGLLFKAPSASCQPIRMGWNRAGPMFPHPPPRGGKGCAQCEPSSRLLKLSKLPNCCWHSQVTRGVGVGLARQGRSPFSQHLPRADGCGFSDIKMSLAFNCLAPWAPQAFSKQTVGQLNKGNKWGFCRRQNPADQIPLAKFICYPTS